MKREEYKWYARCYFVLKAMGPGLLRLGSKGCLQMSSTWTKWPPLGASAFNATLDESWAALPGSAVLVGNATDAVREAASAGALAAGTEARLYCARGGFLSMNGHYAAGMLEGIAHYHPWTVPWMTGEAGAA